jgi:hypothetical protein
VGGRRSDFVLLASYETRAELWAPVYPSNLDMNYLDHYYLSLI